ncbi:MAG: 16S rRNA (guanine(527)-N(7))-methyltransferase RsmG [Prevotella sp.]|nr:16S rRNA (guanine(527)-N(7))-methyltransferase RsmG [Staphylococcus sp.]MCM1351062.1 16S rRNA (guanine(527)-N(7))-methyltransferase RsmG [Prevotella sp.]
MTQEAHKYNQMLNELLHLDTRQEEALYTYYQLLVEWSKQMNLTTITDLSGVYIKHYYDSILTLNKIEVNEKATLLDVGTGAGFPGIVLKIIYPDLKVTLLEPTTKRCLFLAKVIETLQLEGIQVVNERAEHYIKLARESFDFVVARAVAPLNILVELTIPYVKKGGYFLALKGQNYQEELDFAKNAISKLGAKVEKTATFQLPESSGNRTILHIQKIASTPMAYPRAYAKMKSHPL